MKNQIKRNLSNQSNISFNNNSNIQNSPERKRSRSPNYSQSPPKHPSELVDEENLKKEKFNILKKSFNSSKLNNSDYKSDNSASKLFDNKIINVDHAFINSKNPNFIKNSILFRTAEEIQKDILENLMKDYDYKILEQDILDEEEKLKNLNSDPNSLKGNVDQYGIKRGICNLCRVDCKGYQPDIIVNYISSEKYPGYCLSCGCGASNHIPSEEKLGFFPQEILNLAVNSVLIESNVNFNSILVLFEIDNNNNDDRRVSNDANKINSDVKTVNMNNNFFNTKESIFNLIQIIKDAGFVINANSVQKLSKESNIYKIKC